MDIFGPISEGIGDLFGEGVGGFFGGFFSGLGGMFGGTGGGGIPGGRGSQFPQSGGLPPVQETLLNSLSGFMPLILVGVVVFLLLRK